MHTPPAYSLIASYLKLSVVLIDFNIDSSSSSFTFSISIGSMIGFGFTMMGTYSKSTFLPNYILHKSSTVGSSKIRDFIFDSSFPFFSIFSSILSILEFSIVRVPHRVVNDLLDLENTTRAECYRFCRPYIPVSTTIRHYISGSTEFINDLYSY